jgi:hypothetical protein
VGIAANKRNKSGQLVCRENEHLLGKLCCGQGSREKGKGKGISEEMSGELR